MSRPMKRNSIFEICLLIKAISLFVQNDDKSHVYRSREYM